MEFTDKFRKFITNRENAPITITVSLFVFLIFFQAIAGSYNYWDKFLSVLIPGILFITAYGVKELEKHFATSETPLRIEDIDKMDGTEFEKFLAELFRKMGYSAKLTPHQDYGVDLVVRKSRFSEKIAIQAKRYNSSSVSDDAVEQVYTGKALYGCKHAKAITNNYFTPCAKKEADVNGVELWNRDKLKYYIRKHKVYEY